MECPKCKLNHFKKDGIVNKRQRYFCKNCNFCYTVQKRCTEKSLEIKQAALHMYLEGMGFRAIGRILKISNVTVLNWIKKWSISIDFTRKNDIKIIEIDELHSYVGSKKTTFRYGLLLIDWVENLSILCVDPEDLKQEKSELKI